MQLTLTSENRLDLNHTLTSGQTFRWERIGEWWYGVVGRNILKLKQNNSKLVFESYPEKVDKELIRSYFRLDDNLSSIIRKIRKDNVISEAISSFDGLRIIRQNLWECLVSYVCATNSNIKVITQMISNLCRKFGKRIVFEGREFYLFPESKALARATLSDLTDCRLGYRAPHLRHTAQQIENGSVNLHEIMRLEYEEARRNLLGRSPGGKTLLGIGPKAADCILLFSMEKLESFPIDVWIKRLILEKYRHLLEDKFLHRLASTKSLGGGVYVATADRMRSYFGRYAGYAQEYLYSYARTRLAKVTYSM